MRSFVHYLYFNKLLSLSPNIFLKRKCTFSSASLVVRILTAYSVRVFGDASVISAQRKERKNMYACEYLPYFYLNVNLLLLQKAKILFFVCTLF
jgi:uncharacterized membrane protein YecN with MAPEG domain